MLAATMTRGKVTSHSPHFDPVLPILLLPGKDLFFPRHLRGAIEDNQIALLSADPIHIIGGLHQPLRDRCLQGFVQKLELDDRPLDRAMEALGLIQRPLHQQIGATAQPVLPVDPSTAVDDALQERLHQ